MMQFMPADQNEELENTLMDLLVKSESESVFLCDRGGNIMAQQSTQSYAKEDNICALASGSFFATKVLAQLLGEAEFKHALHQGTTTSMYMQMMDCDLMILVVFNKESNPGLVRLYANESCKLIDKMMSKVQASASQDASATVFELDASKQPFTRVK